MLIKSLRKWPPVNTRLRLQNTVPLCRKYHSTVIATKFDFRSVLPNLPLRGFTPSLTLHWTAQILVVLLSWLLSTSQIVVRIDVTAVLTQFKMERNAPARLLLRFLAPPSNHSVLLILKQTHIRVFVTIQNPGGDALSIAAFVVIWTMNTCYRPRTSSLVGFPSTLQTFTSVVIGVRIRIESSVRFT